MELRVWSVPVMLVLLVSASFLGAGDATGAGDHLGVVRHYIPGDLEAKASDLEADASMGWAMVTRFWTSTAAISRS